MGRKKKMYSYEARVAASDKRFPLEMPKQLRPGDEVTSAGKGSGYKVAYLLKEGRKSVVILVPLKRRGRPRGR